MNKRTFPKFNIMGTGASTSNREWTAADEDNATVEDVRPRTAANANLPANDSITGMTKVVEAKNRFLKIKNKEKNTACFQKQVRNWICYICLWNNYMNVNNSFCCTSSPSIPQFLWSDWEKHSGFFRLALMCFDLISSCIILWNDKNNQYWIDNQAYSYKYPGRLCYLGQPSWPARYPLP